MADARTIKFHSDTSYALFKDAAEWRHAANYMKTDDRKLEIELRGSIDPVLRDRGNDLGGIWK